MPELNTLPENDVGLPMLVPLGAAGDPSPWAGSSPSQTRGRYAGLLTVLRGLIGGQPMVQPLPEDGPTAAQVRDAHHPGSRKAGTGPWDLVGRSPGGRKLIAVVHADMVGYSRLIELDDIGTLERLRHLRHSLIDPTIDRHGGWVFQTGGDSLLSVFDSVYGAVACAIAVQQLVPHYSKGELTDRAIQYRVGINIGDVIADDTDLHGDTVNVAVRLEAVCPPGAVCVSRAVRDHVRGLVDLSFEELGPINLKNIGRPVEAFVIRV